MIITNQLLSGWEFGAPLYIPALHRDLVKIANGKKLPNLKSVIICMEDAVSDKDLPEALSNLEMALPLILQATGRYLFVRPRSPEILKRILNMPGIEKIHGFVLPKFNSANFYAYMNLLVGSSFMLMPTVETADAFNPVSMRELAQELSNHPLKNQIPLIRIGGNDLLNLLGIRRPPGVTIYETPLGGVIAQLVTIFKPLGFSLSAPVYEYLNDTDTLAREIKLDISYGLTGKTAIHPNQIDFIEHHYGISHNDHKSALSILDANQPAVFKLHDAMCEVATHSNWAKQIIMRYHCFGYKMHFQSAFSVIDNTSRASNRRTV